MTQSARQVSLLRMFFRYWGASWAFIGLIKEVFAAMEDRKIDSSEELSLVNHFVSLVRQFKPQG